MTIITSVVLTDEDKKFIEENSISLSKLIRRTINDKRGLAATRQDSTAKPKNRVVKRSSR